MSAMNKRYLHHLLARLRRLKYRYIIALFVVALGVFVFAYRQNNITALRLRDEVLRVDKEDGDVEAALRTLRAYTYSHMNANLAGGSNNIYPPIQLKYRYERLLAAEKAKVEAANSKLYTEAQAHCERLMPGGVSRDRVPCIQEYVTSHNPAALPVVPDAMYKFDFVSPVWSPDLAGWSLLLVLLLGLLLVLRGVSEYTLRRALDQ